MTNDIAELLERYRRGAELIAMVMTGAAGEEVDYSAAPGKWTIRQIIRHLADAEIVGAHRFRQVIAEDNPKLMPYDQEAWAKNLDYAQRKPTQSLDTFRRMRADNYELLNAQPETAFERVGLHLERGPQTLHQLIDMYAGHAESHARQIQAIRGEWKQMKGKK